MALIAVAAVACLILGYTLYGRFVASQYALDDGRPTPAVAQRDGIDFVPTRPFYLLGQHFAAISAAGPIAGPILACLAFGWLPCLLWIGFGVVFIGAVHDFSALVASVRHGGASIAEVVRQQLGRQAWLAMLGFIWLALIYVIVAFADITANTFVAGTEELAGVPFNAGGAVAAASTLYLVVALIMGLCTRVVRIPLWLTTAVFVPATLAAVWLGTKVSTVLVFDARTWALLILAYCAVAALLPMWVLMQPRGYLGGFVLYLALAIGVGGLLFGGAEIAQPAFKAASGPRLTDALFPFLFVTIACGACSGFHGLVCSGTTSKQIEKESHCQPIGYGGMLLEGLVALIALGTVMTVPDGALAGRGPGRIFGDGLGGYLAQLLGPESRPFAITFGAMAFSTFVFDTLDVAARLGRYILQELWGRTGRAAALAATLATVLGPAILVIGSGERAPGAPPAYTLFWTLFGTANQLLAGLTLLGISVWLHRTGRRAWFTLAPAVFVLTMTSWSLVLQIAHAITTAELAAVLNAVTALLLLLLAGYIALRSWTATRAGATSLHPVDPAR